MCVRIAHAPSNVASGATIDPVSVAELLDALAHTPSLHGAACAGHPEAFDVDAADHDAIARAKVVCSSCPVLRDCRSWLRGLPRPLRPTGVVAGRYRPPPKLPPLREPRSSPSRDRATVWLAEYMVARGPVISTEVIADAAATGITPTALYLARTSVLNVPAAGPRCRCPAHVGPDVNLDDMTVLNSGTVTQARARSLRDEKLADFASIHRYEIPGGEELFAGALNTSAT